jgi:hypothetical protein
VGGEKEKVETKKEAHNGQNLKKKNGCIKDEKRVV